MMVESTNLRKVVVARARSEKLFDELKEISHRQFADLTELVSTIKQALSSFSASTIAEQFHRKEKKLERIQALTEQRALLLALPVQMRL